MYTVYPIDSAQGAPRAKSKGTVFKYFCFCKIIGNDLAITLIVYFEVS